MSRIAAPNSFVFYGALLVSASLGCANSAQRDPGALNPDDASDGGFNVDPDGGLTIDAGAEALPPNCGDGVLTADEACDDGNKKDGDGCAGTCLIVEPGFSCPTPDKPCIPFVHCGDGVSAFPEQCDDGNDKSGDGCSPTCHLELGYKCSGSPSTCTATVCGDGKKEGAESCDDGNAVPFDGCSAVCQSEPDCATGPCTSKCGDGIVLSGEECDDGNDVTGDGCSPDCKVEKGFTCSSEAACEKIAGKCVLRVSAIFRDFSRSDPDFFVGCGTLVTGMVSPTLDTQNKPVLATPGAACTTTAASFAEWYRPTTKSTPLVGTIVLFDNAAGGYVNRYGAAGEKWKAYKDAVWAAATVAECASKGCVPCPWDAAVGCNATLVEYDGNPLFFPVDGVTSPDAKSDAKVPEQYGYPAWPWEKDVIPGAPPHNFGFTTEVNYWFKYDASKSARLDFTGDDDVWVFINGHLAVDIGGLHVPLDGSVTVDATSATKFDLTDGKVYRIAVFHAERKPEGSSFRLTLAGFSTSRSECAPVCGDAIVELGEECDDGVNAGGYGKCGAGCKLGPHCGDGIKQEPEDCDDGVASGTCVRAGCRVLKVR